MLGDEQLSHQGLGWDGACGRGVCTRGNEGYYNVGFPEVLRALVFFKTLLKRKAKSCAQNLSHYTGNLPKAPGARSGVGVHRRVVSHHHCGAGTQMAQGYPSWIKV